MLRTTRFFLPLLLAPLLACPITITETGGSDSDTTGAGQSTGPGSSTGGFECLDPNSMLDGDQCYCVAGYTWCSDDPDDLTCCLEGVTTGPGTSATSTGGTTGESTGQTTGQITGQTTGAATDAGSSSGGPICPGEQLPPDTCDEGSFWCTQPEACGPEGSQVFRCVAGMWVLEKDLAKDNCVFDGFDFAYGCVDDGKSVQFICGQGPGTACQDSDPASCLDATILAECTYGKMTHFDCMIQCTEIGDAMGVLYDFGSCGEDQGQFGCLCCDMGDPNCPI